MEIFDGPRIKKYYDRYLVPQLLTTQPVKHPCTLQLSARIIVS